MTLKFLTNKPAAVLGDKLIICELHFGIELAMQRRGLNVPLEPRKYADELNKMAQEAKATQLIVIGDFKHTINGFDQRERNYFNELIHALRFEKIIIVKGNHDSKIEEMAKPFAKLHFAAQNDLQNASQNAPSILQIRVEPATGLVIKQGNPATTYGLFHGHAAPSEEVMNCDYLLMGHNHAGVEIGEGKEFSKTQQAWVIIPLKNKANSSKHQHRHRHKQQKLIAFPSFNPLSGSVPFNVLTAKELHGPIFHTGKIHNIHVDLDNGEVILLNGQRIGKVKYLRRKKSPHNK